MNKENWKTYEEIRHMPEDEWGRYALTLIRDAVSDSSFATRLKNMDELNRFYGGDRFLQLGKGSARAVYDIGDGNIVKIAMNVKGLAQNYEEMEYFMNTHEIINATDLDKSDDREFFFYKKLGRNYFAFEDRYPIQPGNIKSNRFTIAPKASKLTPTMFKEKNNGYSFKEFSFQLNKISSYFVSPYGKNYPSEAMDALAKMPIGEQLLEIIYNYEDQVVLGDYCRLGSFGLVNDEVVITDFGLSKDVFRSLYSGQECNDAYIDARMNL